MQTAESALSQFGNCRDVAVLKGERLRGVTVTLWHCDICFAKTGGSPSSLGHCDLDFGKIQQKSKTPKPKLNDLSNMLFPKLVIVRNQRGINQDNLNKLAEMFCGHMSRPLHCHWRGWNFSQRRLMKWHVTAISYSWVWHVLHKPGADVTCHTNKKLFFLNLQH